MEKKRRRAEQLEGEVEKGEARLAELREALRNAPGTDWEKLHELSREEQELAKKVDALMKEWERVSEELLVVGSGGGEGRAEATR